MFLVFIAITLANAKKEREITERQSSLLDSSSATLSAKQTEPTQAATLSSDTERTKAASSIVAAACAGSQIGVVPRGQIGELLKQLLEKQGIEPKKVFNNWEYYWSRARQVDKVNGTNCLQ